VERDPRPDGHLQEQRLRSIGQSRQNLVQRANQARVVVDSFRRTAESPLRLSTDARVLFVVLSMSISSSCPKGATKFPTPPWNHGRRPEAVTFSVLERERAPGDPVTCPQHLFPVEQAPGRRAPPSPASRSERDAPRDSRATPHGGSERFQAVGEAGLTPASLLLDPASLQPIRVVSGGGGIRTLEGPNGSSDFRDCACLAQPCVLRSGARHNARQFWWVPALRASRERP
jgi:hypothetical protein